MIEIELKYEVLNPTELDTFTSTLTKRSTKRVIDHYLDTPRFDLIKKGVYVRVRNQKQFDIKFNRECLNDPTLDLQPYCEEYSFELPLQVEDLNALKSTALTVGLKPLETADFSQFLLVNNLSTSRIVDKVRTSYTLGDFTLVIDTVAKLGIFLEIELMADSKKNIDTITTKMKELLLPLSLKPLSTGYDSLILRKNNFEEYLQSRFILEEDKPLRKAYREKQRSL